MAVVEIKNLTKKYNILYKDNNNLNLNEKFLTILRNPFLSFKKNFLRKEEILALNDIGFSVKSGEIVGIIGNNGSGKSTLLKMISRISPPSSGEIKIKGRVSSLLEIGTGFHPELSGRENIFLNGVILGMKKKKISEKINEIIEFSGVAKFIDTPVKYYSSGMYVRLAFAVSTFLKYDILLVDEVLAVGDIEFKRKSLAKLKEAISQKDKIILFVSHDMKMIKEICTKLLVLDSGQMKYYGEVDSGLRKYSNLSLLESNSYIENYSNENIELKKLEVQIKEKDNGLELNLEINAKKYLKEIEVGIGIDNLKQQRIITLYSQYYKETFDVKKGINNFFCLVPHFFLKPGKYRAYILIRNIYKNILYTRTPLYFEIGDDSFLPFSSVPDQTQGDLMIEHKWIIK